MTWVIVTEKFSVAGDIAKAIGNFKKHEQFYESNDYLITWASGHLVELLSPEDIDAKYKAWLLKDLPIIPEKFDYKPKEGQKERLESIKKLSKRKDVQGIVNACDAGREGELIFREVYDYSECNKPFRRLWLQSMTASSIKKEFAKLKDGHEFDSLGDAARCRAESDWLIGMNATRAVTKRLKARMEKGAWSIGRVQTPTLNLLVEKETEILKHRPKPYWMLQATFTDGQNPYTGQWYDPDFKKEISNEEDGATGERDDRIFDSERFQKLLQQLKAAKPPFKASETRKESKETPPQLFDLTSLQREANRKYGISASRTLQAAQRLYEKHKLVTYPRTDSKYLPEDYQDVCKQVITACGDIDNRSIQEASREISKKGMLNKERVFNDKFVSDHFALMPTGENLGNVSNLEGDDQRVFDLIIRRFLAAFLLPAIWAKVERTTLIEKNHFRTRAQDLQFAGWRAVYGMDSSEDSKLPPLKQPDVTLGELIPQEEKTKPASRLSEARLLSLMEHCGKSVSDEGLAEALKERGIGTPATRADVIENLIHKGYVIRAQKGLRATAKAIRMMDALNRIPIDLLASVELTGEMERDLKLVEKGKKTRTAFMQAMKKFTEDIIEKSKTFELEQLYLNEKPLGKCPTCKKGDVIETFWAFRCSESKECMTIWKEKSQRYIDRSLVSDLLEKKVYGPVEFLSTSGIPFETFVTLNEKGIVFCDENGVVVETTAAAGENVFVEDAAETALGIAGRILENNLAYMCEFAGTAPEKEAKAESKKKKDDGKPEKPKKAKKPAKPKRALTLRMPKTLCNHVVTLDEFRTFVKTGETPVIKDFLSKKGRNFWALLRLKKDGKFEFKFASKKAENGEKTDKKAKKKEDAPAVSS